MLDRGVRRRPSASVSRARFVTAGATTLKLGTLVPLGKMTLETKFRSGLILGLATRGRKVKTQKVQYLLNHWLDLQEIFTESISP